MLDLGLPDMDGMDVIVELRRWSRAPIIVLSGRAGPGRQDRGAGRGRRRLRHQAVLHGRTAGPAARRAAARRSRPAGVPEAVVGHWSSTWPPTPSTRWPKAAGEGADVRLTPTEWRHAGDPGPPSRASWWLTAAAHRHLGTRLRAAAPTISGSTWPGCAASWKTTRRAPVTCSPSPAWATATGRESGPRREIAGRRPRFTPPDVRERRTGYGSPGPEARSIGTQNGAEGRRQQRRTEAPDRGAGQKRGQAPYMATQQTDTPERANHGPTAGSCGSTSARPRASARPSPCSARAIAGAERGTDVVVAFVETHGRPHTQALLDGLEVIPRKQMPYRGRATSRRWTSTPCWPATRRSPWSTSSRTPTCPARATPSAGRTSRNCSTPGIDVISTVNIQHLESLNDVVREDHRRAAAGDRAGRRGARRRPGRAGRHDARGAAPPDGARQHLPGREDRRGADQLLPGREPDRAARAGPAVAGRQGRRGPAALPGGARYPRAPGRPGSGWWSRSPAAPRARR